MNIKFLCVSSLYGTLLCVCVCVCAAVMLIYFALSPENLYAFLTADLCRIADLRTKIRTLNFQISMQDRSLVASDVRLCQSNKLRE